MPEGPEVFLLAYFLKEKLSVDCRSYGKHLFCLDDGKDYSFGLYGRVFFNQETRKLQKVTRGPISGDVVDGFDIEKRLGPDFMSMSISDFERVLRKWKTARNRTVATLFLDQEEIAGLGVAWTSEIAHHAGKFNLEKKGKDMTEEDVNNLSLAMYSIQQYIKNDLFSKVKDVDPVKFVNEWCENLYAVRAGDLNVYKKGKPVLIGSRQFWIA
jgi:formamidopyrimidine-DNA glycosylase